MNICRSKKHIHTHSSPSQKSNKGVFRNNFVLITAKFIFTVSYLQKPTKNHFWNFYLWNEGKSHNRS